MEYDYRRGVDWCLGKVQIAISVVIVAVGATLRADTSQLDGFVALQNFLRFIQSWAWLVMVVGPIAVALVQGLRRRFGNPWAWEAIQKLLDEFREEVFGHLANDPLDHHRVTLFKYRRIRFRHWNPNTWFHWLIAVARSGHLTKSRIRRFRAPDDGEKCEGVVGHAWRRKDWLLVPGKNTNLPVLNAQSSVDDVKKYAEETGVEPDWVQMQIAKGRPLAASYAALVVRLKGNPWGVLVLDSRKADSMDEEKLKRFKAFGSVLTPLLERV